MKRFLIGSTFAFATAAALCAADSEEGFVQLFDGKTFNGWKIAEPEKKSWRIEDGVIVANGDASHLFYVGDEKPFKDFELKVDVMTEPGSNGGIYFHTKFQEKSWPLAGFECQVNVSHKDYKKTGSLYDIANLGVTPAQDTCVHYPAAATAVTRHFCPKIIVSQAASTCSTEIRRTAQLSAPASLRPGEPSKAAWSAMFRGPYGPHASRRVEPNRPILGVPTAAARCSGPVSAAIITFACVTSAASSISDVAGARRA